jgi:uncharacterized protein with HEPN domain
MKPRDPDYLADVLDCMRLVIQFLQNVDRTRFEKDLLVQSAVIRQFEVMGEATKRLSREARDRYREIPWDDIAGFRDVLIHGYDDIYLDEVWQTASVDVPQLLPRLEAILRGLGR